MTIITIGIDLAKNIFAVTHSSNAASSFTRYSGCAGRGVVLVFGLQCVAPFGAAS